MPDFKPDDIDIDPEDFLSACSSSEKKEIIELLKEDGWINGEESDNELLTTLNSNDQKFWDSLNHLKRFRHLLSLEEENFINNLAEKFRHL